MMKNDSDRLMGNAALHTILKRYDPVVPPSGERLARIEAGLMAKVGFITPSAVALAQEEDALFGRRGWNSGAAALAVLMIVFAGYMVEQGSYYGATAVSFAAQKPPTLLALAEGDSALPALLGGVYDNE